MTIGEVSQLMTACASVGALVMSIWNSRKIEIIHAATNSMKDELVKEVRKGSFAAGVKQETDKMQPTQRQQEKPP